MKQLSISQTDVLFANGIYPIEFLLFYDRAYDTYDRAFDTTRLREALRRLSSSWWPIFGVYEDGTIRAEQYDEAAVFLEESRDEVFHIPASEMECFESCRRFSKPDLNRLFHVRVIRFRNGVMVIPKLNHMVGDGYSYFTFLAFLAAAARPSPIPLKSSLLNLFVKPHHNRTCLKKYQLDVAPPPPALPPADVTIECEEIPISEVQSIADACSDPAGIRVSTNDVLSAMALKKIAGSQEAAGSASLNLSIPIDVRRLVPDFGRRFIGNALQLHSLSLDLDTVLNAPIGEIATSIRTSMPTITRNSYLEYLTGLEERIDQGDPDAFRPFDPDTGCLVTNLTRMPTDRLDFGSGPPALIYPLTAGKHAAALMRHKDRFVLRLVH
ncbi:acyltransferase [Gemmatimonadota bacterium]